MAHVSGFPPVSDARARVLILGTMPGAASLEARQYYAHKQNQFWRLMGALIGAGPEVPYKRRLEIMKAKKIALWDVFECCHRPGSLDSAITNETMNDFPAFFAKHPKIRHVFFDSGKAEQAFKKFAAPLLEDFNLEYRRLPSPSPAHAALNFEQKLKKWEKILEIHRA